MIVKMLRLRDQWTYIDGVQQVDTYGTLDLPYGALCWEEVAEAVAHTWGDSSHREFDREIWPTLPSRDAEEPEPPTVGPYVMTVVAHLGGGRDMLLILCADAFLMSDDGKTIDRLR